MTKVVYVQRTFMSIGKLRAFKELFERSRVLESERMIFIMKDLPERSLLGKIYTKNYGLGKIQVIDEYADVILFRQSASAYFLYRDDETRVFNDYIRPGTTHGPQILGDRFGIEIKDVRL